MLGSSYIGASDEPLGKANKHGRTFFAMPHRID